MSINFFFFNDTATTEIYTLSLHDALPISGVMPGFLIGRAQKAAQPCQCHQPAPRRTATQRAQTVLAGGGVVVAMAAANFLEHALLWVLLAVFCGLVVTGAALRYRRRARVVIPAPV